MDHLVGSAYYFFMSWGVWFEITEFIFIAGFWMQLLYTFFLSGNDIDLNNMRKVKIACYVLVSCYFCYQVPITVLCLTKENSTLTTLEAIGFIVVFLILASGCLVQGFMFVRAMEQSQKKHKVGRWENMLFKTKVLLSVAITVIVIVIVHDVIFGFVLDKDDYRYFPAEAFMIFFAEMLQMVTIMFVLAGINNIKNYVLFRPLRDGDSSDIQNLNDAIKEKY
eukprot:gene7228-8401_t